MAGIDGWMAGWDCRCGLLGRETGMITLMTELMARRGVGHRRRGGLLQKWIVSAETDMKRFSWIQVV